MAKYPGIPDPTADPLSLRDSVLAAKGTIEMLTRQRGNVLTAAVTWQDLLDLGLISRAQVPAK